MPTYQTALQSRTDLEKYKDNALLLFTLQLRFEIEDIDAVATDSLTDGRDDKKCDLVYVDQERRVAVVAQGYYCQKSNLPSEAPANKASDLNTAIAWLLATPIDQLPAQLQSAATELRSALENNEIDSIEFWYSHNLPESENVRKELAAVERSARNTLSKVIPERADLRVVGLELGVSETDNLYKSLITPILVSDKLTIPVEKGFSTSAADWETFITTIPAEWLHRIFSKYGSNLFSANIRGYLGSRNGDANINNGIKQTAQNEPDYFCIFNNGITAITHRFQHDEESSILELTGISIVNGAQTTGAIGNLTVPPSEDATIQARFIVCTNPSTIKNVIRYNNSQNKVEATDFRSNDVVQVRLVSEFENIPNAEYLGGRRGGSEDVIRRRANLLPSGTVGQALTAFHGDPVNAYNNKSKIWKNNGLYGQVFHARTTAKHIVFVYSLYELLDEFKRQLVDKQKKGKLTQVETEQLNFFRHRGSTTLATTAIASCLEVILDQQIPDLFNLSFGGISPDKAKSIWQEILVPVVSLISQLTPAVEKGLKGQSLTNSTISTFRSLINATRAANHDAYEKFKSQAMIS